MNHFDIRDEGSIVLFVPLTDDARQWWEDNVADGPTFGLGYAVERRYAGDILRGLSEEGLNV